MEEVILHTRLVKVLLRAKKQKEWIIEMAKLPHREWMKRFYDLKRRRLYHVIKMIAKKRLENRGMVNLGIGSVWGWIEKEWFEKARDENVIILSNGSWIPSYTERDEQIQVGQRGSRPIYETQKVKDYSQFHNFENSYLQWKEQKPKTVVQMSIDEIREALKF